jgi:DNA-binding response OmpR family regulator
VEVAVVRWPAEATKRASLAAAGQPVLLLVESEEPPVTTSPLEDWIRVPSSDTDLEARIEALRLKAVLPATNPHFDPMGAPRLDNRGMLSFESGWVSLSPLEVRLMAALLVRPGAVIPRQQLIEAGWPSDDDPRTAPSRNALDTRVLRLRRRLQPIGLTIRTVRARGYVLDRLPGRV